MLNNKILRKVLLFYCSIVILFFCLVIIRPVAAQDTTKLEFTPNVGIGEFQKTGTPIPVDQSTLGKYISAWYGFIIGTVGILAAIMIMWGGIKWMTSRGGQAVSEAKDIIFSALIGLTLAFLSYTILNLVNPKLLTLGLPSLSQMTAIQYAGDFDLNLAEPGWTTGGGGAGSGGGTVTGDAAKVGDYDFTGYAENANHVNAVNNFYQQMEGKVNSAADAQKYIDQFSNGSPVTGDMVMQAAQQNNVDPAVIIAEMAQDSSLGTAGVGARTNNPGNIGNWQVSKPSMHPGTRNPCNDTNPCSGTYRDGGRWVDNGTTHQTTYNDWGAGVNAVGIWLSEHRAK